MAPTNSLVFEHRHRNEGARPAVFHGWMLGIERAHVFGLHHLLGLGEQSEGAAWNGRKYTAIFVEIDQGIRNAKMGHQANVFTDHKEHLTEFGLANSYCIFQHGVEDRVQLAG